MITGQKVRSSTVLPATSQYKMEQGPDCLIVIFTYRIGFENVGCDHFTKNALATDVPHLHRHLNVIG